eukprot:CFRG0922T1
MREYIGWRDEYYHIPFYEDQRICVYTGTIPPNTASAFHSHSKDTFYVVLASGTATNEVINEDEVKDSGNVESKKVEFRQGSGLVYQPSSPYVHRITAHDEPLAFVGIESLLSRKNSIDVQLGHTLAVENAGVTCNKSEETSPRVSPLEPNSDFGSALTYVIDAGDSVALPVYKNESELPLSRVIVNMKGDWKNLIIKAPEEASLTRAVGNEKRLVDIDVHVAVLSGKAVFLACEGQAVDEGPCKLLNSGNSIWEGVVVDVFGKLPQ